MHKLVNGVQVPLTPEEIVLRQAEEAAWEASANDRKLLEIRAKRNRILFETDYTMLADYQGDDVEDWKTYRQSLRDMTKQDLTQPIIWPAKPTKKG